LRSSITISNSSGLSRDERDKKREMGTADKNAFLIHAALSDSHGDIAKFKDSMSKGKHS